jgi:hypothetical protein
MPIDRRFDQFWLAWKCTSNDCDRTGTYSPYVYCFEEHFTLTILYISFDPIIHLHCDIEHDDNTSVWLLSASNVGKVLMRQFWALIVFEPPSPVLKNQSSGLGLWSGFPILWKRGQTYWLLNRCVLIAVPITRTNLQSGNAHFFAKWKTPKDSAKVRWAEMGAKESSCTGHLHVMALKALLGVKWEDSRGVSHPC